MAAQARLWVIVADGEHARFVVRGPDNALRTAQAEDSIDAHKRSSDLGTDRPGRSFESASPTRHGMAPRHDPHDLAKQAFARVLAQRINDAHRGGAFDEVLLVAPPDTLHVLQANLDGEVVAKVVGTLMKDLVKVPDHALQPHLATWVHPVVRR